jgi:CPA1 family monovalent cation:H+ antiporter
MARRGGRGGAVSPFELAALFLTLVAIGGWLNARTLRLPHGVAMLFIGMGGALIILAVGRVLPGLGGAVLGAVSGVNFANTVLGYLLAFLLFAGAMQVDLAELRRRMLSVWTLATVGVVASTAVVGVGAWAAAQALGVDLSLPWALVFGALISPTDPVAVLATIKDGRLSHTLRAILQGEALFNDGVGIVVFTALVAFASGAQPSAADALWSVFVQSVGGLALGAGGGYLVLRAMQTIDDFVVEVALTLALATGACAAGQALHLSGPIAVVGAGLLIGDAHSRTVMSETTQLYLKSFWTLVDELLNALLFLLLGLQLFTVPWRPTLAGVCLAATLLVLGARFAVVLPWAAYLRLRHAERGANLLLAWGGLHGALSLALALSVPPGPARPAILAATYVTATVSVALQGLTFAPLTRWLRRSDPPQTDAVGA